MPRQNKALELTKPGSIQGGRALSFAASRAIIIKSGFAAQRQRSADVTGVPGKSRRGRG
jgi:hypothetical protein